MKVMPPCGALMFDACYRLLAPETHECGSIAVLPWDTEIFGFAVADYKPAEVSAAWAARDQIRTSLLQWATENSIELISCSISATEPAWRVLLPVLGFTYVDSTLTFAMSRPPTRRFRLKHEPVRLATVEDQAAVERIAEAGFRAGRYHADARFPRSLANRRYRRWVANEFKRLDENNRIYVFDHAGEVVAFGHIRIGDDRACMTIGGVDPTFQRSVVAFAFFTSLIQTLRDAGFRRIESKLSAGNTPMMNVATSSGARFFAPEHVFHWHSPAGAHLLSAEAIVP